MPTTTDLIGLAIDKNPVEFADTFNNIMMQKANKAISAAKIDTAQSIYAQTEAEAEDADEFDEFEDIDDSEEVDYDISFDDLDLDIEDFADAEDTE